MLETQWHKPSPSHHHFESPRNRLYKPSPVMVGLWHNGLLRLQPELGLGRTRPFVVLSVQKAVAVCRPGSFSAFANNKVKGMNGQEPQPRQLSQHVLRRWFEPWEWGFSVERDWCLSFWDEYPTLLVGGFNPSEKYESQWEGWHLIYEMENKIHAPNHQHFTHTLGYPISCFHLVLGWLHGFTYRSWQSLFSEPPLHKLCCGPHWDVLRARNLIQ